MPYKKHGLFCGKNKKKPGTYNVWTHMRQRCEKTYSNAYKWYGARGISVCKRWHEYSNFVKDMGEKPAGLSIDRINNDGNYEPGNCRWATPLEQAHNKRKRVCIKKPTSRITREIVGRIEKDTYLLELSRRKTRRGYSDMVGLTDTPLEEQGESSAISER